MENLNYIDIAVLSLVTLLGLKGLFKGFTKELFGLIGLIGGVFVASRIAKDTGNLVNGLIPLDNEKTALLIGFVISLIAFWIIAYILGTVLAKMIDLSGLGVFDKILGFVFGAGKIFLIFSIIAYALTNIKTVNDALKPKVKESIAFPILVDTGGYIIKLDTEIFQQKVQDNLDKVVDTTKEKIKELSQKELESRALELEKQLKETTSEK